MVLSKFIRPVVLIVEDETFVRSAAMDTFEDAGYIALEAANADEAIGVLESRSDIVLIFTDIQMPGSMNGLRLAAAVRGRWPPIKIMVTSGNFGIGVKDVPDGGRFLHKPYTVAQMTGALRELMAGAGAT